MANGATDPQLTGLVGWVADVISSLGPVGVGLLVALENLFPPIPSEVILPFAGFLAARGRMDLWLAIVAATAGSVGGAVLLYEVGRRVGLERTRRLLRRIPLVEPEEVDGAIDWFHRHGGAAVFTGRFLPFIRSAVSLPAGAERLGYGRFLLYTTAGSAIWNTVWVWVGFLVGEQWRSVGRYSDWLNYALVAAVVLVVVRFVWQRRDRIPRLADRARSEPPAEDRR